MEADPLIGQHLDEYRLLSLLGKGGMARVYLGLDVRLKRYVSIKVIDPPFRSDPDYVRRFQLEAQAIAQLEHPYIVRLYRYGEARGLLYMAMQYIEGADLESVLESYQQNGGLIPAGDAGRIVRELCHALDYAHARGVIHRDVKPSNVILDRQGHPFLTDFGLALLAQSGTREQAFGTPHYMAPEQVAGGVATPLSDLYAVGIVLYQLFTGELPFDADDPIDVVQMQVTRAPRPPRALRPAISSGVQAVILKAMAKAPADRYASGAALAEALDASLALIPAGARAPVPMLAAMSVPDQVTVELTRHPPPPPAETLFPAAAPIPIRTAPPPRARRTAQPSGPPRAPALTARPVPVGRPAHRREGLGPVGLMVGCLAVLLVLALLTAGALWVVRQGTDWLSGSGWSWLPALPGGPATGLPTVATALAEAETPTPLPTIATATPEPAAAPAPTPIPQPGTYDVAIVRNDDRALVFVNRGAQPMPLSPLRLGSGEGAISGSEWGRDSLAPSECVVAVKGGPRPELPNVSCTPVGERIVRRANELFWKSDFEVFYYDQAVTTCQDPRCRFLITVTPQ